MHSYSVNFPEQPLGLAIDLTGEMSAVAYTIRHPITVIIRNRDGYQLREIPVGSVFLASGSQPDANGMIDGTWQGSPALAFTRDLAERAERFEVKAQALQQSEPLGP